MTRPAPNPDKPEKCLKFKVLFDISTRKRFQNKVLVHNLLAQIEADRTVEILDYILPKSLGLICRAGPPASPLMYGSVHVPKGRQWRPGLDNAGLFKNDTKFLNFRHFKL